MRVMQLVKTTRGASWALRQVRELVRLGTEVHVVLPDGGGLAAEYKSAGATIHILEIDIGALKSPVRILRQAWRLRRLVKRLCPQVVHSHFVGTTLMMRIALAGTGTPRLFQVPGLLHLENKLTRWTERFISGPNDYWSASCRRTRQIYIEQGVNPAKVGLAYYGTDFTQATSHSKRGALRQELGIGDEEQVVGMVAYAYAPKRWLGYKRGIKGHEDLIDALAALNARGMDVHGVFVGGAWSGGDDYYNKIMDYGHRRMGRFAHFLGTRGDVANLYPDFNIVVHPSHSENLGGAVESLALAVPTIATNVGGFPDVIIDQKTGWLVPAKNPDRLAEAIRKVIGSPKAAAKIAANGQNMVREKLDVRVTTAQIAAIYSNIVAGKPLSC